jgi:hypothetical protein
MRWVLTGMGANDPLQPGCTALYPETRQQVNGEQTSVLLWSSVGKQKREELCPVSWFT